jgi:hypothetical protein
MQIMIIIRTALSVAAVAGLSAAMAFGSAGVAVAEELSELYCSELWYARNAIYAGAGYCFKTDRAIATFGKRCYAPYGELGERERARVEEIKSWEERKGCGRD